MQESRWYTRPPFLIPPILIAILIAVFVYEGGSNPTRYANNEGASYATHNPSQTIEPPYSNESANERHQERSARHIQPSEQYLFLSDTWAQWLMAVGTIITVGLVAWTVQVTRKMLIEAEDAADAARDAVDATWEIGEAQTRA